MAEPSAVPSAVRLADQCATVYELQAASALPQELHEDLEKLTNHFAQRHQLETVFLTTVIEQADLTPFFRLPNKGHEAIGDFLACRAIEMNISTNVDTLTETAAEQLGEPRSHVAVEVGQVRRETHNPHLKLHGCFRRNVSETLWCIDQLNREPFRTRICDFSNWLPTVLRNRDLIFIGFWSDWSYLNQVLESVVSQAAPNFVVLVNPSDEAELERKAPGLWALANTPPTRFVHVRESGATFLDELRRAYSARFMSRLTRSGVTTYVEENGRQPRGFPNFDHLDSAELYQWRRDSTCTPSARVVKKTWPDETMQTLGAAHLELHDGGAEIEGNAYRYLGRLVRLIHGAGQPLSEVRNRFLHSTALEGAEDVVYCVGARPTGPFPDSIVRKTSSADVVNRSASGTWLTDDTAPEFFAGLQENLPQNNPGAAGGA
jgi:hypothetical protein